jgi:hypothetical protein
LLLAIYNPKSSLIENALETSLNNWLFDFFLNEGYLALLAKKLLNAAS